jgi:hypothetical protein
VIIDPKFPVPPKALFRLGQTMSVILIIAMNESLIS